MVRSVKTNGKTLNVGKRVAMAEKKAIKKAA